MKNLFFTVAFAAIILSLASFTLAKDDIKLVNYKNKTIGFTILVPEKAKVLADSEYGFTTSYVLPDGLHEINVSVHQTVGNVESIDDYKEMLHRMMAKNIIEAKETKNGYFAINDSGFGMTIYHRVKGVTAKIAVPAKHRELGEKIAMSIKSTKKK